MIAEEYRASSILAWAYGTASHVASTVVAMVGLLRHRTPAMRASRWARCELVVVGLRLQPPAHHFLAYGRLGHRECRARWLDTIQYISSGLDHAVAGL